MNVTAINALNVFPVPDGDTGTNMLLTFKAANEKLEYLSDVEAGDLAKALATGALMGARGNSGVILSQFFEGWAQSLQGKKTFDGKDLAEMLNCAAHATYKAVSEPVEGTILTVGKEAARRAQDAVSSGVVDPVQVWEEACSGARTALAETPNLLPILKDAGVVDAGGLGLVAIMEGIHAYLLGEDIAPLDIATGSITLDESYLISTEAMSYGYCTQLLIHGTDLDSETVRSRMAKMADSVVVVGDMATLNVHIHTHDPGHIINYAITIGDIDQVKIDNMDAQHQEFTDMHRKNPKDMAPLAFATVASGDGIEALFRELGVTGIVHGGQSMNPSTQELVDCAAWVNAAEVILLPNNPNILATARQAQKVSPKPIHVIPTTSIPQAVAAILAFTPEVNLDTNLNQMNEAITSVHSGEVTKAVRSVTIGVHTIQKGQTIAILDGELVGVAEDVTKALEKLCLFASPIHGALITLYWGGDTIEETALEATSAIQAVCPGVEIDLIYGGQPNYNFLISIE